MNSRPQTSESTGGRELLAPILVRREIRLAGADNVINTVTRTLAQLGPLALAELEDRPVPEQVAHVDIQNLGQFSLTGAVKDMNHDAMVQLNTINSSTQE